MAQEDEWIITRMRRLQARPFCPECHLFLGEHDDRTCHMRYEEDIVCVTYAPKLPSPESLQSLVGDYGFTTSLT